MYWLILPRTLFVCKDCVFFSL